MKTAIVILNWNGRDLLARFLPSVIVHSANHATIYVADNASTDASVELLKTEFPQVRIIRNTVNGGYAKGYNDALKQVGEELVILMNSDVETTANWLPPLIEQFEKDPRLGAAQPKILDLKKRGYFEYAGAGGGFLDRLGYPYCRGRIFETLEKDEGQYDDIIPIFWASGACLAIRKKSFDEAGALDERYFAHQEEIDLCWRIQAHGYTVKHVGSSAVYHLGGATLDSMNPKKTFLNFRNSIFTLVKNVEGPWVWLLAFMRLVLDGLASVRFLTQGKPNHAFAILKAHFSFYRQLPSLLSTRKKTLKKNMDFRIYSIVYQYFIRNKKHYSSLADEHIKNC